MSLLITAAQLSTVFVLLSNPHKKLMKECFEYEKKVNFGYYLEFDECEIKVSDMSCSIYNIYDRYHYASVNIDECELKD